MSVNRFRLFITRVFKPPHDVKEDQMYSSFAIYKRRYLRTTCSSSTTEGEGFRLEATLRRPILGMKPNTQLSIYTTTAAEEDSPSRSGKDRGHEGKFALPRECGWQKQTVLGDKPALKKPCSTRSRLSQASLPRNACAW